MNNWFKIGLPVLIAVLLVTASVGITLAVTSKGTVNQADAPANAAATTSDTQYARGPLCSNCPAVGQGSGLADQDDGTSGVYVPRSASGSCCTGNVPGSTAQAAPSYRGGCCRSR
jgi:hypothetical protein